MSSAIAAAGVGRTSIACQCASISPGISVRPLPLTITVLTLRSTGMGEGDMRSILLPRTSTLVGLESEIPLPSKTRTFWKRTVVRGASCAVAHGRYKIIKVAMVVNLLNRVFIFVFDPAFLDSNPYPLVSRVSFDVGLISIPGRTFTLPSAAVFLHSPLSRLNGSGSRPFKTSTFSNLSLANVFRVFAGLNDYISVSCEAHESTLRRQTEKLPPARVKEVNHVQFLRL